MKMKLLAEVFLSHFLCFSFHLVVLIDENNTRDKENGVKNSQEKKNGSDVLHQQHRIIES